MDIELSCGMRRFFLILLWLTATPAAQAADPLEDFGDPTRPGYARPASVAGPQFQGPVLQSTMITANQRRAMISGRMYGVGDRYGDGVIVRIEPYEVTLQTKRGERQLRMVPKLPKPRSSTMNGNDDAKR